MASTVEDETSGNLTKLTTVWQLGNTIFSNIIIYVKIIMIKYDKMVGKVTNCIECVIEMFKKQRVASNYKHLAEVPWLTSRQIG